MDICTQNKNKTKYKETESLMTFRFNMINIINEYSKFITIICDNEVRLEW